MAPQCSSWRAEQIRIEEAGGSEGAVCSSAIWVRDERRDRFWAGQSRAALQDFRVILAVFRHQHRRRRRSAQHLSVLRHYYLPK